MLKSILAAVRKPSGTRATAFVGTLGLLLAGLSLPTQAQQLETFDPDEAFEASVPEEVQEPRTIDRPVSIDEALANATVGDADAVDADLSEPRFRSAPALDPVEGMPPPEDRAPAANETGEWASNAQSAPGEPAPDWANPADGEVVASAATQSDTYAEDDLIGAAEGVFGKGAQGLAGLIEDLLRDQGEPNGYIVGREAGGAFIFGARYGSGTLHHKVEGQRKVYWTGPSVGFDAGANAGNTFVLVYNLFDSEDIFRRYPAGEGQAYLVGGMHASYMRRGDVVLIPIRLGAGLRLGVNAGYMRFSKKHRWLPF
ncbi:DUF1134 domain-containing protein [uncultured Erythrobacter sp.]|uniref:DUF1134 domain-containing protein n=1 Tax=uncultured Erythrobacter sp. TaxID=263913 RepID=UPI0026380A14|nr:DUF1134 domain-containing protein [uncultured Erythrobacter sp.]